MGRGPHLVTALKAMRTAAIILAAVVCLALGLVTVAPAALGLQHYVIVGGSMEATIPRGSVVFTEEVPVPSLKVGDVITYNPPSAAGAADGTGLVTHRIFSIRSAHGENVLRTKGDANRAPDPWTFALDQSTQAKVVGHVPFVGYALAALQLRWVRLLAIGLPALLIALAVVISFVRDARAEYRRELDEIIASWDA